MNAVPEIQNYKFFRKIYGWLPYSYLKGKFAIVSSINPTKEYGINCLDCSIVNPDAKGIYILEHKDYTFLKLCSDLASDYIDFDKFFEEYGVK